MTTKSASGKIAVLGPSGRMGGLVAEAVLATADLTLSALVDSPEAAVKPTRFAVATHTDPSIAFADADVYIDFTIPASTRAAAIAAQATPTGAVIGTTGLGPDDERALEALSKVAPVLVASNFSLGVNLLEVLVETAARALGPGYDAELVELHHNRKRDAPSGTALSLAQAVARGRELEFDDVARFERHGDIGPRTSNEIGVQAIRGGDIVGDHTVYLIGGNERIELTHRAQRRSLFADGAVAAARWLVGKPPGRYVMRDVLGI